MTNKESIIAGLNKQGLTLGCWDDSVEKVTKKEMKRVIESIGFGSCTVHLVLRNKDYVLTIDEVDNEVDFKLETREEYEDYAGIIEEEEWRF